MYTGNSIRIISCENHGTVSADDGYTANAEIPGVPAGHTVSPGNACGIFVCGGSTHPVVIENCRNYGTVGKDHNDAAQITFDSDVKVTDCTEQGAVASTPLPPNEPAVIPERPPEEPEESQSPETEIEEKPKEGTIAVGGLYDFDTSDCPSSLTYIVTITQDGELEDKSVESVTNSVICVAAPAMDLSYDHEVIDGAGYLYLTVNWDKPGTYHVSVIVDGSPHSATITVR